MNEHSMQVTDLIAPFPGSVAEARLKVPAPTYMGHAPATRKVQVMIHRAVRTDAPILLVGSRGTGKAAVARILHHFGGGDAPNIDMVRAGEQMGPVEPGPSCYISALENMPIEQQAEMLSSCRPGRRVFGTRLLPESEEGRRRLHPLLLRWPASARIDLPALAERIEDLEQLVLSMIQTTPSRRPVGGIADNALDCLRRYSWPGNLTELESVVVQAVQNGATEQIELRDLPPYLRLREAHQVRAESAERQLCLEQAEKEAIRRALHYSRGNKRKAARLLHIGKTTLYRKLKAYDLQ